MGDKVDNPCVDLCKLKDDICVGCGRSRDEIKRWKKLKNKERKAVRQQAPSASPSSARRRSASHDGAAVRHRASSEQNFFRFSRVFCDDLGLLLKGCLAARHV